MDQSPLLSLLGVDSTQLASQLPTKQEMAIVYAEAIITFWLVGGLTLYLVNKLSK